MPAPPFYPLEQFDLTDPIRPLYGIEEIRAVNPQRFEMEQLTGILMIDEPNHGLVGYKDLTDKEFWVRGHMPDFALMPGVMLCECAAQLAGFYARKYKVLGGGDFLGFGGMEEVRFRSPVFPGDRLLLMAKVFRLRPGKRAEFDFQGYVNGKMVFSGRMIGVPIFADRSRSGEESE
ncbi:beta-hydroxyacyl-ACP dehydratase [bacterium]|nr:beta-hydroxyacyl-ACP dehydratase [bacterium]